MPRLRQRDFSGGWWPVAPGTQIPRNALRDAVGVAPFYGKTLKSRRGSLAGSVIGPGINSQYIWNGFRFMSAANGLFGYLVTSTATLTLVQVQGSGPLQLGGGPLRYARGIPSIEVDASKYPNENIDHLLVAGGALNGSGGLSSSTWGCFKLDANLAVSPWGLKTPNGQFQISKQDPIRIIHSNFELAEYLGGVGILAWAVQGASLSRTTTIKQEGSSAITMTVAADTTGYMQRTASANFGRQFLNGGTVESVKQDWVCLWVHVNTPAHLKELQISFDCGGPTAVPSGSSRDEYWEKSFSYRVLVADTAFDQNLKSKGITDVSAASDRRNTKPYYSGGIPRPTHNYEDVKEATEAPALDMTELEAANAVSDLATTRISASDNTWTLLRIPKMLFEASDQAMIENQADYWSNIRRVRLTAVTNDEGSCNVTFDTLYLHMGVGKQGDYKGCITFRNSKTGERSMPSPVKEVKNVLRQGLEWRQLALDEIYADQVEFWETLGGGNVFFLADQAPFSNFINAGIYVDFVADFKGMQDDVAIPGTTSGRTKYLKATTLPQDNVQPSRRTFDVAGPVDGRMWTLVRGQRGRWFYSPPGRQTVVAGFIDVTSEEEPFNKLVHWNQLYGFSQRKIFVKRGQTEPFSAEEIYGVPGTKYPDSIAVSPYGICYWANDGTGPRLFNGSASVELAPEGTREYFNKNANTNYTAALNPSFLFSRLNYDTIFGVYHEREYLISDGNVTLAVDLETRVWRSLGVGIGPAVSDQGRLSALVNPNTVGSQLLFLEEPGTVLDGTVAIPFRVEMVSEVLEDQSAQTKIIQRLYFDINTNGQALALALLPYGGGTPYGLSAISTSTRQMIEIPLVVPGDVVGVRLSADLIAPVEIHEWGVDAHLPEQAGSLT